MNKTIQWLIVGVLVAVVALQVTVIAKIDSMKPSKQEEPRISKEPRIPSLGEIDSRIMHWTLHHGQHFSSKSQLRSLGSRLQKIEKKLDALSEEKR